MEREDAEGAAAAAEYFIELYPYVMATGDTEEFEAMSHRACGFCDDALEQADADPLTKTRLGRAARFEAPCSRPTRGTSSLVIYPLDFEVETVRCADCRF